MSRAFIVAGNWKMNLDKSGALELATALAAQHALPARQQVALFPPFPWLTVVRHAMAGSGFWLGAQNCSPEPSGAFTGEVSAPMLQELCDAVLAGHSERRALFGEFNELVGAKVAAIAAAGMRPFLCVGEQLAERQTGQAEAIVARQLKAGVTQLESDAAELLVVAYEPVWAIGTGVAATAEDAQSMCAFVRRQLHERFGETGAACPVLYGGSVTPANAGELFAQPDIDGALVGGASLRAETFGAIIEAGEARV
jgi:triosephosphate isomerase